ncbi:hypothetical protein DFQ27_008651 [Actinomortierella ambigua]|uniref:Uncharacterized protein n=1 Tax=Actinomortierella ambigua TaxID=1343610 RepID=A0A9P6TYL7_9FUNG|nr:hypothetical protein DFQ27_008651 [Actinomortierella ambigua]
MLKVQDCTNMTPKQINKLDGIISAVDESQGTLKHEDPAAMACLTALMWDIVHYKAELWKGAFNPNTACTWPEMMEYFTSIPRIAAIYGTPVPAAYKLVDSPKQ